MYEKLPQELKDYPYFCGWKYENHNGNRTKVPKTVKGRNADNSNLKDFCGFDEIIKKISDFDGIGIAITGDMAAIDIDHCIEDGELSYLAQEIISKIGSYTEMSPSGKGVRIIGKTSGFTYDKEKYYINNRKLGLEVYAARDKGQFVTITGNAINDNPLRDITDVLPEILDAYMCRPGGVTIRDGIDAPGSFLTDEEVIDKASASSSRDKFVSLYNGDISEYPSQSEAELAFMTILAFWCGGDEEQMERIYVGSKLYRDKWNRADYRASTLNKALSGVTDFYKPIPVSTAAEDFGYGSFPEAPIPLDGKKVPSFPVDALPKDIADYVLAVAESTQTPVDVAACASLSILSIGTQGKYVIKPKPDWPEPVNTYIAIFMPPSERKSAVCSLMSKPMNEYEKEWNYQNAGAIAFSKTEKSILERRLKALEDQASKGKAEMADVKSASDALAGYKETKPLRYYVDDVTTEKLVSMLSDNDGRTAIFSPEGGIFDLLKGMYTRYVNIDVFLKGYSGDAIRVDRIGRESETIYKPALTIMLMAQPTVLADVLGNSTFRGRGLTARFLYCVPESKVGERKYRSETISDEVYRRYEQCIKDILADDPEDQPVEITLSPEADELLEAFAEDLEPKLKTELENMTDCAGKLVGSVARIAALLCRADRKIVTEFLKDPDPLIVSRTEMENAIRVGQYFLEHAKSAYSLIGADEGIRNCKYVLSAIKKSGLAEVSRRDVMRLCRALKTKDAVQAVMDQLVEYGYLAEKANTKQPGRGRNQLGTYIVNPIVFDAE